MERFLIDTNCISDYLSELFPHNAINFMDKVVDNVPNISVFTQIEILCWNTPDARKIEGVKNFLSESNIFEITSDIVLQCVKIRKGKKIKTPDAIIAATAVSLGYTLITNNIVDFKNIHNLKIVNPYKL